MYFKGGQDMNLSVQIFISLVLSVIVGLVLGDGAAAPVDRPYRLHLY